MTIEEKDEETKNLKRQIKDLSKENAELKEKIIKEYIPLCTQRKIEIDSLKKKIKTLKELFKK